MPEGPTAEDYYWDFTEGMEPSDRAIARHQADRGTWELTEATQAIERHSAALVRLSRWLVVLTLLLACLTAALIAAAIIH